MCRLPTKYLSCSTHDEQLIFFGTFSRRSVETAFGSKWNIVLLPVSSVSGSCLAQLIVFTFVLPPLNSQIRNSAHPLGFDFNESDTLITSVFIDSPVFSKTVFVPRNIFCSSVQSPHMPRFDWKERRRKT